MKKAILPLIIIFCTTSLLSAQKNEYTSYIVKEINREKFTKKGDELVRKYAAKFVELYDSGLLYEVFSFDEVQNTFTLYTSRMPLNLQKYNWEGSPTTIKRNAMGQFSGSDERYYNSIITYWTSEFIKAYPKTVHSKEGLGMLELFSFVAREYFGDNKELCWAKWDEIKNPEQRKTKLIQYSKELVNLYLESAKKNKDDSNYYYKDVDNVMALKRALEVNEWGLIEAAANKMGWTYNKYLYY